ncbi:50S ribosomal protein L21 [Citrus sinensis]|uniref:50S ribosomal protein L21 n=1 Tax=Citrus sinensis TaxID=2711 RepID=A0ACB8NGI0_CITSI|nr:50S ribosomal protein L21 [Citrus sinensis]
MAHRRCLHVLSRHAAALLSLKTPPTLPFSTSISLKGLTPFQHRSLISSTLGPTNWSHYRHFSSNKNDDEGEDVDEDEDEETADESYEGEEIGDTVPDLGREYTLEEKEAEAAEIGYKVLGPLRKSDRVFKKYEPAFAVVQIGSHQFKVSNGDSIFTERLKFCEVNDKLILNKVLLLGSQHQTIIGRPMVPDAAVHAVVEEHKMSQAIGDWLSFYTACQSMLLPELSSLVTLKALDAKVIIFKKKRRKNYRRTKGHRQELTKLRIVDIQGIEKRVEVATAA